MDSFPTIASPPFGPASYGLTFFKSDQVLTDHQLNEWVSFLMAQEQATRARLLGVGIAAGLVPSLTRTSAGLAASLSISAGCGVTTEGRLLRLEKPLTYTAYQPAPASLAHDYPPLADLKLLELLLTPGTTGQPLTALGSTLAAYAVVLVEHSTVVEAKGCTGTDCNEKGRSYDTQLRALLVPVDQLSPALLAASLVAASTAYASLKPLALHRPVLAGTAHATRQQALQALLRDDAATLGSTLVAATAALGALPDFQVYNKYAPALDGTSTSGTSLSGTSTTSEVLGGIRLLETLGGSSLNLEKRTSKSNTTLVQRLRKKLTDTVAATTDANLQYVYDWLKDVADAYEAFRQAACSDPAWLGQALPATDGFGRHLVLGECAPATGLLAPRYRHAWQPAGAAAAATTGRVLWLFRRVESLIRYFRPPALTSTQAATGTSAGTSTGTSNQSPDIMPKASTDESRTTNVLGRKAITTTNQALASGLMLEINSVVEATVATASPANIRITPDRLRPAGFDQRSLPFYYSAEVRAAWSYARTSTGQTDYLLTYPPNAVSGALPFVADPLSYQLDGYDFYRIEGLLDVPASTALARVVALRDAQNLPFDVVALSADVPSTAQPQLISADNDAFTALKADFSTRLVLAQATDGPSFSPALTSSLLTLSATAYDAKIKAYHEAGGSASAAALLGLKNLNKVYNDLVGSLTFSGFYGQNPGLEHGAGVPRGGTFVLTYRVPDNSRSTVPLVVGDYYLPYRQGGGPVTQVVLPPPAPQVQPLRLVTSRREQNVLVNVSPGGGTLTATLKEATRYTASSEGVLQLVGGAYYFQPDVAMQQAVAARQGQQQALGRNAAGQEGGEFTADAGANQDAGSVNSNFSAGSKGIVAGTGEGSGQEGIVADPNRACTWTLTYTLNNGNGPSSSVDVDVLPAVELGNLTIEPGSDGEMTISYGMAHAARLQVDYGDDAADTLADYHLNVFDAQYADKLPPLTHLYRQVGLFTARLTASTGSDVVSQPIRVPMRQVQARLTADPLLISQYVPGTNAKLALYDATGTPGGGTFGSQPSEAVTFTATDDDGHGRYYATQAGYLTLTYALSSGSVATLPVPVFAMPSTFDDGASFHQVQYHEGLFYLGYALLPQPPVSLDYQWAVGELPLERLDALTRQGYTITLPSDENGDGKVLDERDNLMRVEREGKTLDGRDGIAGKAPSSGSPSYPAPEAGQIRYDFMIAAETLEKAYFLLALSTVDAEDSDRVLNYGAKKVELARPGR